MDANIREIVGAVVAALALGGGGYMGGGAVESGERDALQQTIDLQAVQADKHEGQMNRAGQLCTEHVQRATDRLTDATVQHDRILDIAIAANQANVDRCTAEKKWFQEALKEAAARGPIGG